MSRATPISARPAARRRERFGGMIPTAGERKVCQLPTAPGWFRAPSGPRVGPIRNRLPAALSSGFDRGEN